MGARLAIVLGCKADHGPSKSQAQKGSPHRRADYSANNMLCSKEKYNPVLSGPNYLSSLGKLQLLHLYYFKLGNPFTILCIYNIYYITLTTFNYIYILL